MKNDLTEEDYQDAINLTPEQKKAFMALKRAVAKCKKTNVFFYQCLETLGALNGNNVRSIICDGECEVSGRGIYHPSSLQRLRFPSTETDCSFADDTHFVELYEE